MSTYRLALSFALVGACLALPDVNWELYKSQHGKKYETLSENSMRREIFEANRLKIERFNEEQSHKLGYKLGLSHLSDWTSEELTKLNGLRLPEDCNLLRSAPEDEQFIDELLAGADQVPDSVDWRKVPGRVSDVKDQGQCGSCWAFATVGLLEGQEKPIFGPKRTMAPLSEQELVDCSSSNYGCEGGLPSLALDDLRSLGGIETEADYPYVAGNGHCRLNKSAVVMTDNGHVTLPSGDEGILKAVVAKYGPVAVAIDATDRLINYKFGVLDDDQCSSEGSKMNHAVLVVGYGEDKNLGSYWIVKNSWGAGWGDYGYFKMVRNKNQCGIANLGTIAKFQ